MEYRFSTNPKDEYPHMIILESANREGLVKHQKLAVLTDEIIDWLAENFGGNCYLWTFSNVIGFSSKEDAMGFMLRWG